MKKKYEQEEYDLEWEDLTIPEKEEWIERMSKEVDEWLNDMKERVYGYIPQDIEDYDQSGKVYKVDVDDIEAYMANIPMNSKNIIDNLYIGSKEATYSRGCGWRYITFGDCIRERLTDELFDEVYFLNKELCWWVDEEDEKKAYIIDVFTSGDEWLSYPFELVGEYTKKKVMELWEI